MDSIFTLNTLMISFIPFLLESSHSLSALRQANKKDLQELPGTRGKAAHHKLHLIIKKLLRKESTDWRTNLHLWREYLQTTIEEDSTIGMGFPAAGPGQRASREPGSDPT